MKKIYLFIFLFVILSAAVQADPYQMMSSTEPEMEVKKEFSLLSVIFLLWYPDYYLEVGGFRFGFEYIHLSHPLSSFLEKNGIEVEPMMYKPKENALLLAPPGYFYAGTRNDDEFLLGFYTSPFYQKYRDDLVDIGMDIYNHNYSTWSKVRGFAQIGALGLIIWGGCQYLADLMAEKEDPWLGIGLMAGGAALSLTVNITFIIEDAQIMTRLKQFKEKVDANR